MARTNSHKIIAQEDCFIDTGKKHNGRRPSFARNVPEQLKDKTTAPVVVVVDVSAVSQAEHADTMRNIDIYIYR